MLKQTWTRPATMPMDAYRNDGHLVIDFDVPGVDAESIEVNVEDRTLKVVAPRPRPTIEGVTWLKAERAYGTSTCQLYLGDGLDLDAVEANVVNGVLTVTIPMVEGASRRVEVTRGEGNEAPAVEAPAA